MATAEQKLEDNATPADKSADDADQVCLAMSLLWCELTFVINRHRGIAKSFNQLKMLGICRLSSNRELVNL